MSKIRHSLSTKLSLSILLLAIPIFILSLGILFLQSRYFIRQEASERANSLLNITLQHVRNFMTTIETATNANMWLLEEKFHPDSIQSIAHRIVQLNRHVYGCSISAEPYVFPQYGRYFSVYSVNEGDTIVTVREPNYEYFEKVWYRSALVAGKACWVDPFDEFSEGTLNPSETIASYCMPIRQKDGRIVGGISTDLSFSKLAETINAEEQPYPNAYFMLLGGDGRYFIHPDTTLLFRKTIFTDADPIQQSDLIALGHEMTGGKQGHMHLNINGNLCHVNYRPVPGTDWSLALICPDSDILKSYNRLTYIVIALIIVGLLVILLRCRQVVNHTISPINRLLSISQKLAEGNYDEMILQTDREDAIGQLQNSFATMQQSLNFHMGIVRHTAEGARQRNEELARATQLAEEAVRQKSIFLQNVSHQIRTPLNIILGFAQVLRNSLASRSDGTKDSLQKEELVGITNMMKHNSIHLNRMVLMLFDISDIGTFEESQASRTEHISCNEVARECIDFTQSWFPNLSIRFETVLPDDFRIYTNHLFLMRTIRELLYNSVKYSDGKHLTLRISQTENTVQFIVEDVGPGLPEESLDSIFKPFSKIDDLTEGLGLGLPLCKRHIGNLGGDLIFDSDYHDGCRFIIEMPK